MIKHTQLTILDFQIAVKETETFKKGIVIKNKNIARLHDYYQQACRNGIDYLRQNPNIFGNEVNIIEEILNK